MLAFLLCFFILFLDNLTFDKLLSKFDASLIKFDVAYPYGDKHEEFAKVRIKYCITGSFILEHFLTCLDKSRLCFEVTLQNNRSLAELRIRDILVRYGSGSSDPYLWLTDP
jgi:hypothetical protein